MNRKQEEVKAYVVELIKGGVSHRDIALNVYKNFKQNVSLGTISGWRKEVGLEATPLRKFENIDTERIPDRRVTNWREAVSVAKKMQGLNSTIDYGQYIFEHKIDSNEPIILAMVSDPHFGSVHMDYDAFKHDVELVGKTRNTYLIWGNDDVDNFPKSFKNGKAIASQIFNPHQQKVIMASIMGELVNNGKIIAFVPGNHNDFGERETFDDIEWWRHKDQEYAYMPNGGLIKLTVGNVEYCGLIKHKFSGGSGKNKLNSNKTMLEKLYPLADFTLQGDKHDPALELEYRYEYDAQRQIIHLRAGTYKTLGDDYSRKFFKEGVVGVPALVLFPKTKHIVPFLSQKSLEDAITYCNGLEGAKKR